MGNKIEPDFDTEDAILFTEEDVINDFEKLVEQNQKAHFNKEKDNSETIGLFRARTANKSLEDSASQPDPNEFYPVLIVENETTICFADTGIGKTVYAVQIANYISKERKVIYIDLELSDKQFEKRYKDNFGNHYKFNDNLYRLDFTPHFSIPKGIEYDAYFIQSLLEAIKQTGATVVVIDNMTKLAAGDTDSAKATIPIMESLTKLKRDYGITFLLLEHNKKVDSTRPISLNDLQGSKMKSNFADAVFTIGRSVKDKYIRYIKQLKVRSAEHAYDTESVLTCELTQDDGFLHFRQIGFTSEWEHLKEPSDNDRENIKDLVLDLNRKGMSLRDIGKELNISHMKVSRILKENKTPVTPVTPTSLGTPVTPN